MPNDTLREEIATVHRAALAYIASKVQDSRQRRAYLQDLRSAQSRLAAEIDERRTRYLTQLNQEEQEAIERKRAEVKEDQKVRQAFEAQKADQQQFENLRHVNGGGYPRNISPVIYVIPLILVGVAEWYVNYSTFSAQFIPVFAIAATLIVAAVFAWASHLHGAYLKQISEIMHPSVEYRNVLGRKLALYIVTALFVAAFVTVVWLRWLVISEQLGTNLGGQGGTFGDTSWALIWSKVAPTVVINLLIWGLGTLYSWAMHEKVLGLRESYRNYLRAAKSVASLTQPFLKEERRIKAQYDREREKNNVALNEYTALLEDVRATCERIQESETA